MGMLLLNGSNDFGVRQELFANGEQGLWLDPSDMTAGKAGWRRNLLLQSEAFDSSSWLKSDTSVTANSVVAPNLQQSADSLIEAATTAIHRTSQSFTSVTSQTITVSVYAKAIGPRRLYVNIVTIAGAGALFDLTGSGSVIATTGTATNLAATISSVGDGWYRCSVAGTGTGSANNVYFQINRSSSSLASDDSFLGDGSSGIYLFGAQLEYGPLTEYQPITDFSTEFKAAFPTHTLYQDSNGVTPCTAAGDPVGLILDQSRGGLGALGSEVVPDPTLTSTTGWALDASWTASGGNLVADNSAQAAQTFASSPEILTQGKQYLVVIEITAITGAGGIRLDCRPTAGGTGATNHATITTTGTHRVIVNNTGANTRLALRLASNTQVTTATVASISVREVPGNHASQSSSSARPTLARLPVSGRRNLLTRTEEFDNAAWTKVQCSITANNSTAPDGTSTADLIVEDSTTNARYVQQAVTTTVQSYTFSVYLKNPAVNGRRYALLYHNESVKGWAFDLQNGVVGAGGTTAVGAPAAYGIESVGNGWYRCYITITGTAASNQFRVYPINNNGSGTASYTGDGVSGILVWGAQLETGSTATNYQKVVATTDVTESGVGDLWHLVFDGSDDSLVTNSVDFSTWTQGARRNLLTETNSMIHATGFWSSIRNTDTYGQSDPFGTNLATLMVVNSENVSGSPRYWQQITTTGNYRFSVYIKKYNHRYTAIQLYTTVCYVDFDTGTISGSGTIQDVGNGWFRVSMTANMAAAGYCYVYSATGAATVSSIGLNTLGCYCFGGQLESGTAAATDYQPVGTDEMTVIAGVRKLSDAASAAFVEASADAGSNSGAFAVYAPRIASAAVEYRSRGTLTVTANEGIASAAPTTLVFTGQSDISDDSLTVRKNGVQAGSSSGDQGTGNYGNYQLFIGRRNQATLPYNGHLYQLIVRGRTTPTGKLLEAERFTAKKTGVTGI